MAAQPDLKDGARRPGVRRMLAAAGGHSVGRAGFWAFRTFAIPAQDWPWGGTRPSIALSHTRLDLGEGRPGEQLEGSFTVSNRGSEPLEFKLSASCGCAFVRPMAGTLAPAQSQGAVPLVRAFMRLLA